MSRADRQAPISLSFGPRGLVISVLSVHNRRGDLRVSDETAESAWQVAARGMSAVWNCSFPVDAEIETALFDFLRARQPEAMAAAVRFLDEQQGTEPCDAGKVVLPLQLELLSLGSRRSPTGTLWTQILRGQRRAVRIYFAPLKKLPSHVGSPLWRRFWGIFRYGHLETLGFNWSLSSPGYMVLNTSQSWRLGRVAAHELGHIFGLGDAYAAIYRGYAEHPNSRHYLMNTNGPLSREEFLMFLKAHTTGRAQFFPRPFQLRQFLRGLRSEIAYYLKKSK